VITSGFIVAVQINLGRDGVEGDEVILQETIPTFTSEQGGQRHAVGEEGPRYSVDCREVISARNWALAV
jgi:hypothetical protein